MNFADVRLFYRQCVGFPSGRKQYRRPLYRLLLTVVRSGHPFGRLRACFDKMSPLFAMKKLRASPFSIFEATNVEGVFFLFCSFLYLFSPTYSALRALPAIKVLVSNIFKTSEWVLVSS